MSKTTGLKTIRFTKGTRIYNSGEVATFKAEDADHYIAQGGAYECDLDGNRLAVEAPAEAKDQDYSSMSKEELVALAEKRELTVTRGDGKDGDPVKPDYVAALQEADKASEGTDGTEGGESKGSTEGEEE